MLIWGPSAQAISVSASAPLAGVEEFGTAAWLSGCGFGTAVI
jgi:hypothetical protein